VSALAAAVLAATAALVAVRRIRPRPRRLGELSRPLATRSRRIALPSANLVKVAALVAAAITAGLVWAPLALVVPAYVWSRRRWHAARAASRHRIDVRSRLPDVIDLVSISLVAGLTPRLALPRLAQLAPAPFGAAFRAVLHRVEHGTPLADAWSTLVLELGDEARPLALALAASERYGMPLAPAMDLLGAEARHARRRQSEAVARRLPVRLAFPLTCCVLPAFVLLTIVPLLGHALDQLPRSGPEGPPVLDVSGGTP